MMNNKFPCVILKINWSLQPTPSKDTLILRGKKEKKEKANLVAKSRVLILFLSHTRHMTSSRSFLVLPYFPICEAGQKFLPMLSHSFAVRADGY